MTDALREALQELVHIIDNNRFDRPVPSLLLAMRDARRALQEPAPAVAREPNDRDPISCPACEGPEENVLLHSVACFRRLSNRRVYPFGTAAASRFNSVVAWVYFHDESLRSIAVLDRDLGTFDDDNGHWAAVTALVAA